MACYTKLFKQTLSFRVGLELKNKQIQPNLDEACTMKLAEQTQGYRTDKTKTNPTRLCQYHYTNHQLFFFCQLRL